MHLRGDARHRNLTLLDRQMLFCGHDGAWPSTGCRILTRPHPWRDALRRVRLGRGRNLTLVDRQMLSCGHANAWPSISDGHEGPWPSKGLRDSPRPRGTVAHQGFSHGGTRSVASVFWRSPPPQPHSSLTGRAAFYSLQGKKTPGELHHFLLAVRVR